MRHALSHMSLPSCDDPGPFSRGYSELQSDLLTLGRSGAAPELAVFIAKHKFSSVDAAFPHAFGHSEDRRANASGMVTTELLLIPRRLLHFAVYFNNMTLVRHLVEECQCDMAQVTR